MTMLSRSRKTVKPATKARTVLPAQQAATGPRPERYELFQGDDNGLWGLQGEGGTGILYEPSFTKETAEAVLEMEHSDDPPEDWFETAIRLTLLGLPY